MPTSRIRSFDGTSDRFLPFDAPNRFVFWGNFSVKYGITVAPVLDIRNGFPLSVIDEDRNFVGQRNRAGRFPNFRFARSASAKERLRARAVQRELSIQSGSQSFQPDESLQSARLPGKPRE